MNEERLNEIRNGFIKGSAKPLKNLKKYKKVCRTVELLKYDIDHFDSNKNYLYFFNMFRYLSKACELNTQEQKRIYEEFQEIRAKIKQVLLTHKKDENRKILKKTLGKLEIISLELCSKFDESYDKSKRDLVYQLVFQIKNRKVIEDVFEKLPHQMNILDNAGYELLVDIFQKYILVLQTYVKDEQQKNLDDLIYYDRLIQFFLEKNKPYMNADIAKNLDKILEEAENYQDCKVKERYIYFLRKWRVLFLNFRKNGTFVIPEVSCKELMYQFQVSKDFSEGLLESAKFLYLKYGERKQTKDMTVVYTLDGEDVKDKDDGFSCEKDGSIYHLGIHITCPMVYLNENDILFEEGTRRGNTIYFNQKPFSYLFPPLLAENFFGFNEGYVRQSFSAYFTIDLRIGKIINKEIKIEPVYIKKNDTYENGSRVLQYGTKDTHYLNTLENIQELVPFLKRYFQIDETYAEVNFVTHPKVYTEVEHMNETLMIFMNHQMALLAKEEGIPFLYRNHVMNFLYEQNLKELQKRLGQEKNNQVYLNEIAVVLGQYPKSMYEVENKGHHGLGLSCYTHITSPDRRMADDYNMLMFQKCYFKECSETDKENYKRYLEEVSKYLNERSYALRRFQSEYSLLRKKNHDIID